MTIPRRDALKSLGAFAAAAAQPDGMTVDSEGYLYVATRYGIQICDQAGRVNAIIAKPQPGEHQATFNYSSGGGCPPNPYGGSAAGSVIVSVNPPTTAH